MNRLRYFTNDELNTIEVAFTIALDNTRLCDLHQRIENLADEVSAEKRLREKIKNEGTKRLIQGQIADSNYGAQIRPCDDDEKLAVLCMINKQLKEMQDTLAKINDKI